MFGLALIYCEEKTIQKIVEWCWYKVLLTVQIKESFARDFGKHKCDKLF